MKKSLIILVLFITTITFISCSSKSGKRVSEKKMKAEIARQDSINLAKEVEKAFKESLILEGYIWLKETEDETSPAINFGISANSDNYLVLTLIESRNLPNAPEGNGIPLEIALKVKEVIEDFLEGNKDWRFNKEQNGMVTYGFATNKEVMNPLDKSMYLLDVIKEKTGWNIKVTDWGTV